MRVFTRLEHYLTCFGCQLLLLLQRKKELFHIISLSAFRYGVVINEFIILLHRNMLESSLQSLLFLYYIGGLLSVGGLNSLHIDGFV